MSTAVLDQAASRSSTPPLDHVRLVVIDEIRDDDSLECVEGHRQGELARTDPRRPGHPAASAVRS